MRLINVGRAPWGIYNGLFGNPFRVGWKCSRCKHRHFTAGETIPCFKQYLWKRIQEDENFRQKLIELDGAILECPGCFPGSKTCHARVLESAIIYLLKHKGEVK